MTANTGTLEKILITLDSEIDTCIKQKLDESCAGKIWKYYITAYSKSRDFVEHVSEEKISEKLAKIAEETITAGMPKACKEAIHWLKQIYNETGNKKCRENYNSLLKQYEAKFNEKYNGG